jgi:hypothetical protein
MITLTATQMAEFTSQREAGTSWTKIGQQIGVSDKTAKAIYQRGLDSPPAAPEPEPTPEPVTQPAPSQATQGKKPARTTFYLSLITRPMTPDQMAAALIEAGWEDEGRPKVVATLIYLAYKGKLTAADSPQGKLYLPKA